MIRPIEGTGWPVDRADAPALGDAGAPFTHVAGAGVDRGDRPRPPVAEAVRAEDCRWRNRAGRPCDRCDDTQLSPGSKPLANTASVNGETSSSTVRWSWSRLAVTVAVPAVVPV